jgi:hypothetical protein
MVQLILSPSAVAVAVALLKTVLHVAEVMEILLY